MKTTNWLNIAVAALILAFILAACPLPNDTDNTGSEIESINWVIDNIDSSFSESIPYSASIQFFIKFETPGLTASDIASVYIESPIKDISWVVANSASITEGYDAEENYFWCRLSSSSSSTNGSVLPVGTYNFTVRYSNGSIAKSSLLVPAPGAIETGSTLYVYTEDYMEALNPPSDYAALPRRANNISAVLSASELTIKFSVNDGNIYNSEVWFYDSEQAYIGTTNWFRDFSTGLVSSALNDGKLHNDGTENTLVLSEFDIEFAEGKGMTDIDSLFIILTDGIQHVSNVRTYDTTSISQKVEVATTGIEIESINWGIDNIDSSFSESIPYSAAIQFFINFETPGPAASDIASVYIESPISDISWVIADPDQITALYDAEGNYFWCRLFSTSLSTNGSVLPVGTYNFTVRYSNGSIAKSSLLVPAPGEIETGSTLYVYTEDYMEALNPPSDYAALPRRANNISAVLSASELTIKFSVNDGNIYNSEVWFYDSEQAYVGTTDWFRDFSTGLISSALNDGKLHNDGTENTLVLLESDIQFAVGKGMNDIDSLFIFLTDGIQHASNVRTYDTTSISQKVEVATTGIEIESINWIIDSRDASFSESVPYSASIQFFIYFETPGPTASDIASVHIESPIRDLSWTIAEPAQITVLYNAGGNFFWCQLFSESPSANGSVLPVGTYNFTIRYSNGSIAKSSLLVPAPGEIETGSTLYVYTEDYMEASNPPSDYAALPRRANNISAVRSASELTIKFSVNDSKIYNSEVWFYDSEQAYIGTTDWFRDFSTGSVSSALNDGKLYNDGTENTLVLPESDIQFEYGKGMNDIDSLLIILTDGIQYTSNDRNYDTRSVSQRVDVVTTGIEIESINWGIDNIDSSFSKSIPYSANIRFVINFETPGPTASDIASVHIESPIRDISWKIADPDQITALYNAGENYFQCRLYSDTPSANGSVLPVGTYNFTITYSNGSIAKSSLLVPAPGTIVTGSTLYVYTEDYMGASNPPSDYAALPRRANNISAGRSASELTIKFSVDDGKIYNSKVLFYDSEQAYVGTTDWFRDFSTGLISSALNDGKLHNDGTENTLVLLESDIQFAVGKGMNDIDSLFIFLTDGIQYASNNRAFDTRSVSQRVSVGTN